MVLSKLRGMIGKLRGVLGKLREGFRQIKGGYRRGIYFFRQVKFSRQVTYFYEG